MCKQVQFRGELVWGLSVITDRFEPKSVAFILDLIVINAIKKFQLVAHKTLLLILARFSGKMPVHRASLILASQKLSALSIT